MRNIGLHTTTSLRGILPAGPPSVRPSGCSHAAARPWKLLDGVDDRLEVESMVSPRQCLRHQHDGGLLVGGWMVLHSSSGRLSLQGGSAWAIGRFGWHNMLVVSCYAGGGCETVHVSSSAGAPPANVRSTVRCFSAMFPQFPLNWFPSCPKTGRRIMCGSSITETRHNHSLARRARHASAMHQCSLLSPSEHVRPSLSFLLPAFQSYAIPCDKSRELFVCRNVGGRSHAHHTVESSVP
ncbi:hypothetical protein C8Q76DRAFT_411095 [Earliella scabrosa]|nr:hypothetical protein C8Q76DRAFT_411095 [Earliella scabrosa]